MTCIRIVPIVGLVAAITIAASSGLRQGQSAKVGDKVPSFSFEKMVNSDGRTNLDEFRGQPILVDFWGTH
jgi:hypothetical protein